MCVLVLVVGCWMLDARRGEERDEISPGLKFGNVMGIMLVKRNIKA